MKLHTIIPPQFYSLWKRKKVEQQKETRQEDRRIFAVRGLGSIQTTKPLYCMPREPHRDQVTQLRSWRGSGRPAGQGLAPSPGCPQHPYIPSTFCPSARCQWQHLSSGQGIPAPTSSISESLSILHVSIYPQTFLLRVWNDSESQESHRYRGLVQGHPDDNQESSLLQSAC